MRAEHEMTIMLTTHYLDEADSMAERVVVVDHGEVIADDTAEHLKNNLAGDRIVLTVAPLPDAGAHLAEVVSRVENVREVTTDSPGHLIVRVDRGPQTLPRLLRAVDTAGFTVTAAELHRPTLDDVFLGLTGRSLRESSATAETDPASTDARSDDARTDKDAA